MTKICPACGEPNPDHARFCLACASPLDAAAPPREERKIISVLFVDLVGSTARADRADPEDVRALLRPYHDRVKLEVERFGGVVEKFVGDAVMAVFGAPVAHEDDAERAVRAALRVLAAIEELNEEHQGLDLAVRGAVNTGEAVVSLDARPERGEAIAAGDVLNVAARLQQAAPVAGVLVGEVTYRATRHAVEYEEVTPAAVKGKAEPVRAWRALRMRSRFGVDVEQPAAVPLVGREHELALLRETWARAVRESSLQLVTVTGEPGVGKSRLVQELRRHLDDAPELVWWRQGRCLPYGDGITFWALGEVVKAHAGILETDDVEVAEAKLVVAVESLLDDTTEREWLSRRLAPLVGIAGTEAAEREDSFAAWRRFLEALAMRHPLVLVIEDLHWADAALLEFLDHLLEWTSGVPLLVVCTARPELYEQRPGWGGGKRNTTTLSLAPLTPEETATLVGALLSKSVLPAETQSALLERSGGNPLYAEEFVRMLGDRPFEDERLREVPESIHAVVAARLDTLPVERKSLLYDAAVVGKVFWTGTVAAIGGTDAAAVRVGLRELVRKELVRASRTSSFEGDDEFTFWHALVRDVAYQQIPRAERAQKHRQVAAWLEDVTGERIADHAEILVHHYGEAATLARAAGADATADERALRRFLIVAGERALRLDVQKAISFYERALALPDVADDRGVVLIDYARALWGAGRAEDSTVAMREALSSLRDSPNRIAFGEALLLYGSAIEGPPQQELLEEALDVLERERPSRPLVQAYSFAASVANVRGRLDECVEIAERASDLAREIGAEDLALEPLEVRGQVLTQRGDPSGLDLSREALRRALAGGYVFQAIGIYNNLALVVWLTEGAVAGDRIVAEVIEFADRFGLSGIVANLRTVRFRMLQDLGRWDEFLEGATAALANPQFRADPSWISIQNRRALILARRGELEPAAQLLSDFMEYARTAEEAQVLEPALLAAALVAALRRDRPGTLALAGEFESALPQHAFGRDVHVADWARLAILGGDTELAERLVARVPETMTRYRNAILSGRAAICEAHAEYDSATRLYSEAARNWHTYGNVYEHAHALLGEARCRVASGGNGRTAAEGARAIFAELQAKPELEELDVLLGRQPEATRAAK